MSKKDIFMKEYLPYIIVIIIVLLIKAFIVTPIRVNGPSMLDTLEDKDIMILDEVSFKFKGLKRFDIVVVNYKNEKIIKRVVGLPGETVEYKDNKDLKTAKINYYNYNYQETEVPNAPYKE